MCYVIGSRIDWASDTALQHLTRVNTDQRSHGQVAQHCPHSRVRIDMRSLQTETLNKGMHTGSHRQKMTGFSQGGKGQSLLLLVQN